MKKLVMFFVLIPVFAADLVEFRGTSNNSYRYADWSHVFGNKVATDIYYVGVPDYNELTVCGGYALPAFKRLKITPLFCGVATKEDGQFGAKAAVLMSWKKGAWKADAYYAHLFPLHDNSSAYDVLDAGNITRTIGKKWEVGISGGFFRQEGKWNPLIGPLIRRNDRLGFWAVSFRTGTNSELRFARIFLFNR